MARKPNVLFIIMDSMRADAVGLLGNPICRTPNIDRLGREGVAFRRCFAQHPACAPSRAAMLTGWYPHVRGHRTFTYHIQPDEPNLFRIFKRAGYSVKAIGTNDCLHEDCFPDSLDEWIRCEREAMDGMSGSMSDDPVLSSAFLSGQLSERQSRDRNWEIAQKSAELLRKRGGNEPKRSEKPWLFCTAFHVPHPKYGAPEPWFSMYDPDDMPDPVEAGLADKHPYYAAWREATKVDQLDARTLRQIRAIYYGMVSLADHYVGQLLEALRDSGQYDDTIVVLVSDHGDMTGDLGLVEKGEPIVHDNILNVPLVIKPHRGAITDSPGRVENRLVENIDILPTLCELAGVELTHSQFGKSLAPILSGRGLPHKAAVFAEGGYNVEDRFALNGVRRWEWVKKQTPSTAGPYLPKMRMQHDHPEYWDRFAVVRTEKWKFVQRQMHADELYDLEADPHETVNLIERGGERGAQVAAELKDRLLRWYLDTCDSIPKRIDHRLCAASWNPQTGLERVTVDPSLTRE